MNLQSDLDIFQNAVWHLAHRRRKCCRTATESFMGPVEADESYFGGKAKKMHARVRAERITGRGADDKATVAGVKDRAIDMVAARVVESTDAANLQGFVFTALTAS
ncbi:transposase [Candidatus Poriferisocius sp.]|uniref:transposase n=1 Tax=Candidatus Poriferisocius sp. TaxID=3101276 RepID=UPI003B01309F